MENLSQAELEDRIQALLSDDLSEPRRRQTLGLIARDEQARKLLRDLLALQDRSREAFGYHRAEGAMEAGLSRLKEAMKEKAMGVAANSAHTGRPAVTSVAVAPIALASKSKVRARTVHRVLPMRYVMWLVVGCVVMACVSMAVVIFLENHQVNQRLAELDRNDQRLHVDLMQIGRETRSAIQVSAEDLKQYSTIWRATTSAGESGQPWILIRDGVGRFEYLPAATSATSQGAGQTVVMRCSVVSPEGTVLEEFNLLLPKDRTVQLTMDESRRLGGRPLRCRVASEDRWVGVGLELGEGPAESVGVQGRVAIGGGPAEIGQFRLDHRNVKVFLQAKSLAGAVG